jgi:3',5'-cyclic AMP phosphodiesterase CpdA
MSQFRLTQISDTHLARGLQIPTENFHRVSAHIDATRPDLVINSGDLAFSAPTSPDDLAFAMELHAALPVPCRYLPGNHDIGDNPTTVGPAPRHPATEPERQKYIAKVGDDRWRFDAAGWCFVGLNSMVLNTGLACEAEQFDWLASELSRTNGKPVALFLHKPLFLNAPGDPELAPSAIRYVPPASRQKLIDLFGAVDLRLVASGHIHQRRDLTYGRVRHVWAPAVGFIIPDRIQELISIKETGLVEYRFTPDSFEVLHVRVPGMIDVDLDQLRKAEGR